MPALRTPQSIYDISKTILLIMLFPWQPGWCKVTHTPKIDILPGNVSSHIVVYSQPRLSTFGCIHYSDVIMGDIASQITSLAIVYSTVYSGTDQRKHRSSASLDFVRGIHRRPVNSPHNWPVTRKIFPFDDVIMFYVCCPNDHIGTNCCFILGIWLVKKYFL